MTRDSPDVRVAVLCGLALVLEGYDISAMAYTLPALAEAWHLRPVAFTSALTAGSVGLFIGSLLCGWLGDRFGRKPVLLACVAAFSVMSLATIYATTPAQLTLARLLTGIGLGGGIPTSIALVSDLASRKRQGGLVIAMTCGVTLGNAVGGFVAAKLLAPFGWQSVFLVGGIAPLVFLPLLALLLPESAAFVAARRARVLRAPSEAAGPNPVVALFRDGFAPITALLWTVNFLNLLTLYFLNFWLPSMVHSLGVATETAIIATTMFHIGGITGAIVSGPIVGRFGVEKVLVVMLTIGTACLLAIGLLDVSVVVLAGFIFGCGLGIPTAQFGLNSLPGAIYPTAIRSTGTGWSLGVGRLGNIAGPLAGGLLLSLGWTPKHTFVAFSLPVVVIAGLMIVMTRVRKNHRSTVISTR